MTSSSKGVETLGVSVVIGCLSVLCLLANGVLMVLTCRKTAHGAHHSATNLFLLNLAVSDVILGGVTMPLMLMDANVPDFTKNDVECKLKMALPLFNIFTSVSTMLLLSFDRLRVIVQGQSILQLQARVAVALTWFVSLALTAPQFYEYRLVEKVEDYGNETKVTCSSHGRDPVFKQTYAIVVLVLGYLLPLTLLTKNYAHVIYYVVTKAAQVQGRVSRVKITVLRTIVTISVVFVVLWLPFFLLFAVEEVTGTDDSSEFTTIPHVVKQIFVSLSAVSNPFVYFTLMPDYRQACARLLLPLVCFPGKVAPSGQATRTLNGPAARGREGGGSERRVEGRRGGAADHGLWTTHHSQQETFNGRQGSDGNALTLTPRSLPVCE